MWAEEDNRGYDATNENTRDNLEFQFSTLFDLYGFDRNWF